MIFTALLLLAVIPSVFAERGLVGACRNKTIETVSDFQPEGYLGRWYEIGRSDSFIFDHGCEHTFAEYSPLGDEGEIEVNNTCYRDGKWTSAVGSAELVGSGKFEVRFFGPFKSPYDIVYLSDGYEVSLVVSCSELGGSNIWILSREPHMSRIDVDEYLSVFDGLGFVVDDFRLTVQ